LEEEEDLLEKEEAVKDAISAEEEVVTGQWWWWWLPSHVVHPSLGGHTMCVSDFPSLTKLRSSQYNVVDRRDKWYSDET
jgi:hypothetical protein